MDYLDYSGFEPDSTTFYDQNSENYEKEPCDEIEGEPESTSLPALLPPCRICTRKASGFHYGVNTCEACKVLRNLKCKIEQQHTKDGQYLFTHRRLQ